MNRTRWYQSGACCLRQTRFRRRAEGTGGETGGPKRQEVGRGCEGSQPTVVQCPLPQRLSPLAGYEHWHCRRAVLRCHWRGRGCLGGHVSGAPEPSPPRKKAQSSLFWRGRGTKTPAQSLKRTVGFSLIPCASSPPHPPIPVVADLHCYSGLRRVNHNKQHSVIVVVFGGASEPSYCCNDASTAIVCNNRCHYFTLSFAFQAKERWRGMDKQAFRRGLAKVFASLQGELFSGRAASNQAWKEAELRPETP